MAILCTRKQRADDFRVAAATAALYYKGMISHIARSLTHLAEPIGFVWLCLLVAVVLLWVKRIRKMAVFLFALAVLIYIVGSTSVPGDLLASLEQPFVVENLENIPVSDAIVVLGGAVRPSKYEAFGLDLGAAADRIVMGLELARRGKARNLVLGGSTHTVNGRTHIEADMTKQWLETWGLTNALIFSLGGCGNTHDEAVRVAALVKEKGWQRVILVTSAFHMRRAQATFQTAGVPVVCVPCDFQTEVSVETEGEPTLVPIPGPDGFQKISLFLHEQIGWLAYRRHGWVKPLPRTPSPGAARAKS
jgi:uncharacterized SAM-binding protein YcdF (DUF218 family)